ncbi:hypothetical protein BDA99DRAFT_166685 [Phascolomyces articulosus]|uniref:Inhibitor I9 domain-containing protein n=1 Tax=Phascolomyces articulosus TaxID=60185 RepID=A0AAD5PB46_9FUNG|nr:hypothetical protein BDA99DRAFT_166685 [Phascolomyces articulosus]
MYIKRRIFTLAFVVILVLIASVATGDKSGFSEYILVFKRPVSQKTYDDAKADVISAGGQVSYEYHSALQGLAVSLPDNRVNTFKSKSYIDYVEKNQEAHTMSSTT